MLRLRRILHMFLTRRYQPRRLLLIIPLIVVPICASYYRPLILLFPVLIFYFVQICYPTLLCWIALFVPTVIFTVGLALYAALEPWFAKNYLIPAAFIATYLTLLWLSRPKPIGYQPDPPLEKSFRTLVLRTILVIFIIIFIFVGYVSSFISLSEVTEQARIEAVVLASNFARNGNPAEVKTVPNDQLEIKNLSLPTPLGRIPLIRTSVRPRNWKGEYPIAWAYKSYPIAPFLSTCHWGWFDGQMAGERHCRYYFCLFGRVWRGPDLIYGGW